MPLESNPEVINEFIQKMGLKTELFSFTEMLSTEEWALEMIPQPVLGILFLYEVTPVQKEYKTAISAGLQPENAPNNVFFMKQHARNACGTIALFHITLNALEEHPEIVTANSYLENFKLNSSNIDPNARGELFKNSKDILDEHKNAVVGGQSNVQNDTDSHFVAFIVKNNELYELDGMTPAPISHGNCSKEDLLPRSANVIKEYMARDPDNLGFSMIVLAATSQ